jgi:peptidoglycan L-alanyl-D-glutamate endopeptidase CwlK
MQGVHPELVAVMHRALETSPIDFAVVSGKRTAAEQEELVRQGFSECSANAGCRSKHLDGLALDVAPVFNGDIELRDHAKFRELAPHIKAAAEELGVPVRWLGDVPELADLFHWETKGFALPNVAGYRRAQQAEVSPHMTAHAVAALQNPLGSVRGPFVAEDGRRFKVLLEPHSNAAKGASVFLQPGPAAA